VWPALAAVALAAALAGCSPGPPEPPNIILVVLDTVRDDYAGDGQGRKDITPNYERLVSQGTEFTHAWSVAPWTAPSHVSMLTGLLPSEHGCTTKHWRLDADITTMAEIISESGYETAAFYSNPWLTDGMTGMMRGFEINAVVGPNDERQIGLLTSRAQGGPESVRNISRWLSLRSGERPFFMFVNFLEAHLPYAPPPVYRDAHPSALPADDQVVNEWAHEFNAGLHPAEEVDWNRVNYLYAGDVFMSDRLLGSLLDLLEEHGLDENTVVIVTSDHGENLGDHGLAEHQFGVFETLLSVPLVVRAPGLLAPGERNDPVMLTDLFATVLDLAGAEVEVLPQHSRSLFGEPSPADRPIIAEYAGPTPRLLEKIGGLNPERDIEQLRPAYGTVRIGDLRLTAGSDGTVVLHDVGADPGQTRDIATDRPDAVDALMQHLPMLAGDSEETPAVDERMREWLESLGYVM